MFPFFPDSSLAYRSPITTPTTSMTTRRRVTASSNIQSAQAAQTTSSSDSIPPAASHRSAPPEPSRLKWFKVYYAVLCSAVMAFIAVWFLFIRNPHPHHPTYDTLTFLPYVTKNQIMFWYRNHSPATPTNTNSLTVPTTTIARNDIPDLLTFLSKYEARGYFDSPAIKNFDHYMECMVNGWLTGVFESVTVEPRLMDEIRAEELGVGAIPGGSRRLNAKVSEAVAPIVNLLLDSTLQSPATPLNATAARLTEDHRNWLFEALSHCHTTPCRLAKMRLIQTWRSHLALFPEHEQKENWNMLIQLFHPDTHPYKLIDAPATAATLGSLWLRFFSTGDIRYVRRILSLTRLTGAPAYATEKDREIREWHEKKFQRLEEKRYEKWNHTKEEGLKKGETIPEFEPHEMAELPESPTGELHQHFRASLLYYGAEDHPLVRQAIEEAILLEPKDQVLRSIAQAVLKRS